MLKLSAATAAAALLLAAPAFAQSEPLEFELVNDTQFHLTFLYISEPSADTWEEDILGDQVIAPGETAVVTVDDGLPLCEYDLRADFEDGDSIMVGSYDLCAVNGGSITVVEE